MNFFKSSGRVGDDQLIPNENQNFVEEKFKELDSDQIDGGEFEFLGLETRFERNKRLRLRR